MNALEIQALEKNYGKKKALKGVSISVSQGSMFALIGPNGAGKTTLIKSVLGLTNTSGGTIKLFGENATHHSSRKNLAYLPEKFSFFPYYSVEGVLRFYGKMYGTVDINSKIEISAKRLSISEFLKLKLRTLSKGQLQRVGLAAILMGNANFFLLDEPFTGLDPIGIKDMKDTLSELKKEGKTILINSHILSEIEKIIDDVAIINEGVILKAGTLASIVGSSSLENAFYSLIKGTT